MSIAMTPSTETSTKTEPAVGNEVFNVPNQITMARFVLAIVVFVLIPLQLYLPALIVFVVAAATDWVDGYWARKYGQVTQLGRMLDPFVDKIIICGTFVFLAAEAGSLIAAWMAVVVIGRELLVTALRSTLEQQGRDFSATMPGKLKMVFQCGAVVCSLLVLMQTAAAAAPAQWLIVTTYCWVYLAVLSTIYSGVIYVFAAMRMMSEPSA